MNSQSKKRHRKRRLPKRIRLAVREHQKKLEQAIHDSFYRDQLEMDWDEVSRMVVGLCGQVGFHEATKLLIYLAKRTHQGWFGSTDFNE